MLYGLMVLWFIGVDVFFYILWFNGGCFYGLMVVWFNDVEVFIMFLFNGSVYGLIMLMFLSSVVKWWMFSLFNGSMVNCIDDFYVVWFKGVDFFSGMVKCCQCCFIFSGLNGSTV